MGRMFNVFNMVQSEGETSNKFSASALIKELETWEAVLKSEPEVIHKLRAFEAAASDGQNRHKRDKPTDLYIRKAPAGPSR